MTEKNQKENKVSRKFILSLLLITLLVVLYADAKYFRIRRLNTQNIILKDELIPTSFDNTKLLIFSDINGDLNQLNKVKEKVSKEKPDFIIFLGNLINDPAEKEIIKKGLEALDAPLGKYAILNKDDYQENLELTKELYAQADFRLQDSSVLYVYNKSNEAIQFVFFDLDGPDMIDSDSLLEKINPETLTLGFSSNKKQITQDNTGIHTLFSSSNKHSKIGIPYLKNFIYDDQHLKKHEVLEQVNIRLTSGISTPEPALRLFSTPDIIIVKLRSSE